MPMERVSWLSSVGWATAGALVGVATVMMSIGLAGGGHGWTSPVLVSMLSVLAAPVAGVAWSRRGTSHLSFLLASFAFAVLLDVALLFLTMNEGVNYLETVVKVVPGRVAAWALLFGSWQVLTLAALWRNHRGGLVSSDSMETHTIRLVGGEGNEAGVLTATGDDPCRISFAYRGRTIEAEASDFFEAFCSIRLKLESEGLLPFCYGGSLNVYPSGMARDMGLGLKAYKMEIGKHAQMQDLVEIFTAGPDVVPASVERQRAFWEEWLATPRV